MNGAPDPGWPVCRPAASPVSCSAIVVIIAGRLSVCLGYVLIFNQTLIQSRSHWNIFGVNYFRPSELEWQREPPNLRIGVSDDRSPTHAPPIGLRPDFDAEPPHYTVTRICDMPGLLCEWESPGNGGCLRWCVVGVWVVPVFNGSCDEF